MIKTITDTKSWDDFVIDSNAHPLQLSGWGELKRAHGWRVERVRFGTDEQYGAQLLVKSLPFPFNSLVYVPRGPFSRENYELRDLEELVNHVKTTYNPLYFSIEPHKSKFSREKFWRPTSQTILIGKTLILDLVKSEAELQSDMSKKTRQYIRKSASENNEIIHVKNRDMLEKCLQIYHQTAKRAGFALHGDDYYYDLFEKMGDYSVVFAALKDGEPVAFVWLAISGEVAFELYGGMNEAGQKSRANYALKWHAISTCKQWGIREYDMNGLLNDGVSTFKRGFAQHENRLVGTLDYPMSPLYGVWSKLLPSAKKTLRTIKNIRS